MWKFLLKCTHLFFSLLGDDSEPVSDHAEHGSKVRQAHHDPETHHGLVVVQVLWALWAGCTKQSKRLQVDKTSIVFSEHREKQQQQQLQQQQQQQGNI